MSVTKSNMSVTKSLFKETKKSVKVMQCKKRKTITTKKKGEKRFEKMQTQQIFDEIISKSALLCNGLSDVSKHHGSGRRKSGKYRRIS